MEPVCIGDHQKHLCMRMTNPHMDETDLDEIRKLVRNARFICKNCGNSGYIFPEIEVKNLNELKKLRVKKKSELKHKARRKKKSVKKRK